MREPPDLEIVNRTLGEALRKSEADVKKLREALLKASSIFRFLGHHTTSDEMHQTWKETGQ